MEEQEKKVIQISSVDPATFSEVEKYRKKNKITTLSFAAFSLLLAGLESVKLEVNDGRKIEERKDEILPCDNKE